MTEMERLYYAIGCIAGGSVLWRSMYSQPPGPARRQGLYHKASDLVMHDRILTDYPRGIAIEGAQRWMKAS